ncbi:hypothetical protein [Lewinella sp. IMCC34183]|uniref:hypothetical protein n=1 Tax=Lewinella sp. IMCC34183 TaxID=2248762 RepID=UPI000E26CF30|nr:hypothetical protein [Lewinella sp. IMCC34183]
MSYRPLIYLLLFACNYATAQDSRPFVLQTEEDGVRVYVRDESAGELSVRVVTQAATTLPRVRRTLDEASRYDEWVHRCDGAYIVPGGTANNFVYVSGIDMPFPFRDKEVVARVRQWVDAAGVLTRTITAEPGAIPPTDGRDRLTVYGGEWVIRPLADGEVELQCTVRTDAGAGLPGWLRKEIMTGGPARTVANLRRRLEAAR